MTEVVGVLLLQGNSFVLQHRDDIPTIEEPGLIGPWGGAVEPEDTSLEDAAVRELFEETGVDIKPSSLVKLVTYETTGKSSERIEEKVILHMYLLELDESVEVKCYEGLEIYRVETIDEVPVEKRSEALIKSFKAYEQTR
jgi:8-oxo-dGTP pyrophosphatase MutT (NUDIX family)